MDMNAYCLGHLNGKGDPLSAVLSGGVIAAFPGTFITEAAAFGAETGITKNGFPVTGYVWTEPAMLTALPMLDETAAVKAVLETIETAPRDKTALLKVNGPYSILASLVEPSLFYRWLRKNKREIHAALDTITRGLLSYMLKALQGGVTILSLADPYADMTTLGKERYAEFAAHYLVSLLGVILNRKEQAGVIHLCPYNSLALEELDLVTASVLHVEYNHETYVEVIDSYNRTSRKDHILLAGHQCIYAGNTGRIIALDIQNSRGQRHEL